MSRLDYVDLSVETQGNRSDAYWARIQKAFASIEGSGAVFYTHEDVLAMRRRRWGVPQSNDDGEGDCG